MTRLPLVALAAVLLGVAGSAPTAGAATPPGTRSVFFGINVPADSPALVARAAAAAGRAPSVDNIFVKLDSAFTAATLRGIADRDMTPMVSLEPWSWRSRWGDADLPKYGLRTIVRGQHDAALFAVASAVAAYGRPVYLRFAHEMNGWWYPWAAGRNGNSAADYVAAWRRVKLIFSVAGAANAKFVWSPNALTGSGLETPLEAAYPGDPWVDYLGMTAYGHGGTPAGTYDATYARLAAVSGKPIILSETGAAGAGKAGWMAGFGPWLAAHPRVVGFVWFNTTPTSTDASGDYRFDDSPANATVFRQTLGSLP